MSPGYPAVSSHRLRRASVDLSVTIYLGGMRKAHQWASAQFPREIGDIRVESATQETEKWAFWS